ncbi:MAG TPA: hypothetical protein VG845_08710 [Dehalococcoidia bacterium]|nr:hypothetical protein [Dehalococcoidia bacterium]
MPEVFAGFVAGYAMAVITTPMLSFLLIRLRLESDLMSRLLPEGTSAVGLSVLLHGALAMTWTALGLLLGLILLAMRDSGEALGSLNGAYTLFVAGLFVAIGAPLFALLAPIRRLIASAVVVAILVFGWLTPYLAHWSES